MGRTCGEPVEIKKNAHPTNFTALLREQATWSEADLQNPGLLRDWNEELQSIRELPQVGSALYPTNVQAAFIASTH